MNIEEIKEEYLSEIEKANSLEDINEIKNKYLSKKGKVSELMGKMKDIVAEKKASYGQAVNNLKTFITDNLDSIKENLESKALNEKLERETIDVTMPGKNYSAASKHPLNKLVDDISEVFVGLGYKVAEGPEVEKDLYNFEMLNLPKDHPARDMQDTFYVDVNTLLRTHTSPVQARTMEASSKDEPIRIICPGKVFRKDDDATHSHQFMQMEGLVIGKNVTMSDLKGTLDYFMKQVFGQDKTIRFRSSYFPFTEPSVEVDVSCTSCGGKGCNLCKGSGWMEILGAGMVHPNVLKMSGFDPEVYQGFAFGIGLDRIIMLQYGIDDIKRIYTNDLRFLNQFRRD